MNQQSTNHKNFSRRQFLGGAAAAAMFTVVPRQVLGGSGVTPPSEKLNIAAVGAGGQAASDIKNLSSENIVALCDVDDERAAKTFEDLPNAKRYRDFRKMLEKEDKNIDAVLVATPDHVHAAAAMMALKMGKHVYCEKPLTYSVYEARQLAAAAKVAKVATQMGNQGRSGEGVRRLCEMIWDGAIGPVREIHAWTNRPLWTQGIERPAGSPDVPSTLDWDLWLGPAPQRPYNPVYLPENWRGWWDFGSGAVGDMGCHVLDPVYWSLKLGAPTAIEASSTKVFDETLPLASLIHYDFPARGDLPPVKLHWYDGGLMPKRPEVLEPTRRYEDSGSFLVGEKGIIMTGTYGGGPRIIPEVKMKEYQLPAKILPRSLGHHAEWIDACKTGKPTGSNFETAALLTEICILGSIAVRTGKRLEWDAASMVFTNAPDANKYLQREYRQGWSL